MLSKLRRELARVADASFARDELLDHAWNFAVTGWHTCDWVWEKHFKNNPTAQQAVVAGSNPTQGRTPPDFKNALIRQCPELATCQDIANGFKHVEASRPSSRPASGAEDISVSASVALAQPFTLGSSALGDGGLGGLGYEVGSQMFALKIKGDSGQFENVIPIFDAVLAFWTKFFATHGIR
jgi:hypothetical protein